MVLDTLKVLDAVAFAALAHDGQRRKYVNEPYIIHPIRVARRVSFVQNVTTDMICAALLHDVLEDCPHVTSVDIENQFGYDVYQLVKALTDEKPFKGGPNRAQRKQNTLKRLRNAGSYAQTIKCADLLDNLTSIIEHDKNFGKVFLKEAWVLAYAMFNADKTIRDELFGTLEYYERWGWTHSA